MTAYDVARQIIEFAVDQGLHEALTSLVLMASALCCQPSAPGPRSGMVVPDSNVTVSFHHFPQDDPSPAPNRGRPKKGRAKDSGQRSFLRVKRSTVSQVEQTVNWAPWDALTLSSLPSTSPPISMLQTDQRTWDSHPVSNGDPKVCRKEFRKPVLGLEPLHKPAMHV